jgi:hypothetical protein
MAGELSHLGRKRICPKGHFCNALWGSACGNRQKPVPCYDKHADTDQLQSKKMIWLGRECCQAEKYNFFRNLGGLLWAVTHSDWILGRTVSDGR